MHSTGCLLVVTIFLVTLQDAVFATHGAPEAKMSISPNSAIDLDSSTARHGHNVTCQLAKHGDSSFLTLYSMKHPMKQLKVEKIDSRTVVARVNGYGSGDWCGVRSYACFFENGAGKRGLDMIDVQVGRRPMAVKDCDCTMTARYLHCNFHHNRICDLDTRYELRFGTGMEPCQLRVHQDMVHFDSRVDTECTYPRKQEPLMFTLQASNSVGSTKMNFIVNSKNCSRIFED